MDTTERRSVQEHHPGGDGARHEGYRGYRGAGIRLKEDVSPGHHSHDESEIGLYAVHMFDKAHVVMLVEGGLLSRDHGAAILSELRGMERAGVEAVRLDVGGGMHSGEQYLIRRLGEAVGGRIHLGRSSGDLKEVANRVLWRDRILVLVSTLNALRSTLLCKAREHKTTVMPGYSQGQQAQPTTYGHQLIAWAAAAGRDVERLRDAYTRVNRSPAGAAIMTGSSFRLDRHRTAELLGFDRALANTLDAIMSHDVLLELHATVSILHADLLRWSEDIMLWSSNEFDLIDIPDRFCGTSSIMMQKKNATTPQEIKGAAAAAIGGLMTAFVIEKSPTGTAMLDRHASVAAFQRSLASATRSVSWMTEMVDGIEPRRETMASRAGRFWAQATDIGAMLVEERDLPWRTAHQIVGILVRQAYERGLVPDETTSAMLDEAAVEYLGRPLGITEEQYRESLDPVRFVTARVLYGGPAPDEVDRRLPEFDSQLHDDEEWVTRRERDVMEAATRLEGAIHAIAGEGETA